MGDTKRSYNFGFGSWMFVQCALLVLHYGFKKTLPWWVLLLPSIALATIIIFVLSLVLIGVIISALTD